MKKIFIYFLLAISPLALEAQFKVTFRINEEINLEYDTVFIAGIFNDWTYDTNGKYELKDDGNNKKSITLNLEAGEYSYKFHRGNLGETEMSIYGNEVNRKLSITKDTILTDTISAWKDFMPRIEVFKLSQSILNKNSEIFLDMMNIWLFKQGNEKKWAETDLNTTDWDNIRPADITESLADENGKTEGWFRAKIRVDSSMGFKPLNFSYYGWQAIDVYLDGDLQQSYGNTGNNGMPFKENHASHTRPQVLQVLPGTEHLLAIHFVDKLSSLPKSAFKGNFDIRIINNELRQEWENHINEEPIYTTLRLAVGVLLSLLFWLLVLLNSKEKHFRIIAVFSTLLTLFSIVLWMPHNPLASYNMIVINNVIGNVVFTLVPIVSILLFVIVFNRKVTKSLKTIFAFYILFNVARYFFTINTLILAFVDLSFIIVLGYYIISSWKSLKGAQWVIIIGLLLFFAIIILGIVIIGPDGPVNLKAASIFLTVWFLSFPLCLVVYVALRFKEIIKEVKQNANELIQVTEEKKEILASQNIMLDQQVQERTAELNESLNSLKATQSQLIQSEKMASLGELTAGIAHEIQNPLNFINNFSEVNKELLEEMKDELQKGNMDEVNSIVTDILLNESKILHHGKRADAIVKDMLQHSRISSGAKVPTDINALADEYLRLAYHGLRAKDKRFNADFRTELDKSLPKIDLIAQDMGRVLLNLINNAFYAVNDKKKQQPDNYKPIVIVSTKSENGNVLISVKDNGNGIPTGVKDKIFQPFFTTKPTGEGTGLGLSLSYDIITKGHKGDLIVKTKEGEGTEFIIVFTQK